MRGFSRIMLSLLILLCCSPFALAAEEHPVARISTNFGEIILELDRENAPITVNNFLQYVSEGHYEGTVFHRVMSNFMIQGGGYTKEYREKPTHPPIENEANNGLKNTRGTIAMARTNDPHSATSQFFINLVDNHFLDYTSEASGSTWGYAVFGRVIEGMDVVDLIGAVPTSAGGPFIKDVPVEQLIIKKIEITSSKEDQ